MCTIRWPGRYITGLKNLRFSLYACPGLQVTEGMKCRAHLGQTRLAQSDSLLAIPIGSIALLKKVYWKKDNQLMLGRHLRWINFLS